MLLTAAQRARALCPTRARASARSRRASSRSSTPQCRGFLLTLEHSGILSSETRELVIERALAASGETLTLEQLKLVVLMVLWNQQTPTSRLVAEDLFSAPRARAS